MGNELARTLELLSGLSAECLRYLSGRPAPTPAAEGGTRAVTALLATHVEF